MLAVYGIATGEEAEPAATATPRTETVSYGGAPLRRFSVAATGDILIHGPVAVRAAANASGNRQYDFRPMFEEIAPIVADADLGVCHMETPISPDNANIASYPLFNIPTEIAADTRDVGYDLCSTASNHSLDQGADGVVATIGVLEDAGLAHTGTAVTAREAKHPPIVEVKGARVATLSYTYGLNGLELPAGEEHLVNVLDIDRVLRDARRARRQGAEFVIVALQWGQEFQKEPTEDQLRGSRRLLRSPLVDMILGHHTHVVQPVRRIGREWAVLGMGNVVSNQHPGATATCCLPETQDGLLVVLDVTETGDGWRTDLRYVPTWVEPGSFRVLPVARALRDDQIRGEHGDALQESWDRTVSIVTALGADEDGAEPLETP